MLKLKTQFHSTQGARHTRNDDHIAIQEAEGIYIICDGVSEGGQGKIAAELITHSIQESLIKANATLKNSNQPLNGSRRLLAMQEYMSNAFMDAQTALEAKAQNNKNYQFAATTCIAVWLWGRFATIAHVGDSRAYLYRKNKLYQLTKDHSGYEEMIKRGIPPEAAKKSSLARSLTRALGNAQFNQPDLLKIEFEPNDNLFLCTDGVHSAIEATPNMAAFVQDLVNQKDLKPWMQKCSTVSGDDSSVIQINFKVDDAFSDLEPTLTNIQASDRIELIRKTPLSKYLDFSQKSHIAAICDIHQIKAGTTVIRENDDGDSMYINAIGELIFEVNHKQLSHSNPGDFFGEIALIKNSKRTASVVAKTDSVLLSLNRSALQEIFKKDPLIETRIYKSMLETLMDRFVSLTEKITTEKH